MTAERLLDQERRIELFGLDDLVGDYAVAHALHTNHERVKKARQRATYALAVHLGWRSNPEEEMA